MIVIMKQNPNMDEYDKLKEELTSQGILVQENVGTDRTVWGLLGDTSNIDAERIAALEIVEGVKRLQEPYKKANRKVCFSQRREGWLPRLVRERWSESAEWPPLRSEEK